MEVVIISVMGAGLLGFLGILVQYLFSQNTRRAQEHHKALAAIAAQGQHSDERHHEAMAAIAAQGQHTQELHHEAMAAFSALDREHRDHREKLHNETMTTIAALSERAAVLETRIATPSTAGA